MSIVAETTAAHFAELGCSAPFGSSLSSGPGCCDLAAVGVGVGHVGVADSGVTAIVSPRGSVAAVDVRGGGPGTRETDLLAPENTVERVNAVVLSGGSAFGLAAADGAMRELAERGIGFQVTPAFPEVIVPIVPSAVIFDLLLGSQQTPEAAHGRQAVSNALSSIGRNCTSAETDRAAEASIFSSSVREGEKIASGCVGAGIGAMAGALKGGFGQSCVRIPFKDFAPGSTEDSDIWVAALMVTNPMGAVVDPHGRLYGNPLLPPVSAKLLTAFDDVFVGRTKVMRDQPENSSRNTTIGCVITNAPLTQAQAKRLAMCAHDGLARAIRPAHAPMDGDTIFAMSTVEVADAAAASESAIRRGEDSAPLPPQQMALLTAMAADSVQFAIVDAVIAADARAGISAYRDGVEQ